MEAFLASLVSIAFHGLAYGMILYAISVGLSVTMGLMGFVNLAHGVFAMAGGYLMITAMTRLGLAWVPALVLACVVVALGSMVLERLLYSRLYTAGELEQVLFTIGLIFVAVAVARLAYGPLPLAAPLPDFMKGQTELFGRSFPSYRVVVIVSSAVLIAALWIGLERTRWGAMVRAAVDNRAMAQSVGINTVRLFTFTFALGSGLAALGGALGADLIAMTPTYPFEQLVYFLIVVSIGGLGTLRGPFLGALLIGIGDTACKYWVPQFGAFFVYAATMVILLWRPQGLLGEEDVMFGSADIGYAGSARLRPIELAPWVIAACVYFFTPNYLPLGAYIVIVILFALSLDLILGYGGIVTLGHAAYFGFGAYAAGVFAIRVTGDPLLGLVVAAVSAGLLGLATGAVILRTHGLALLMLTLAINSIVFEVANKWTDVTGGADGLHSVPIQPILGMFRFDMFGKTAFLYCLIVLAVAWWLVRTIVHSPFGVALAGTRENDVRMHAIGAPVYWRRLTAYTISATLAGIAGGLLTQTTQFVGLSVLGFERSGELLVMLVLGGVCRIYGAFVGPVVFIAAQDYLAKQSPEYWTMGIGILLIVIVMFARGGLLGLLDRARAKFGGKA